jgi:predicted transcriptional regulator
LAEIIKNWKEGSEKNFLVFDHEQRLSGVLTSPVLMEHKDLSTTSSVEELTSLDYEGVEATDSLMTIIRMMQEKDYEILPVYENQELVGVVDWNDVEHFIRIQKEKLR